jgi:catechol 2,3-dioxygenase-like lactoylglutathione lyase family enzyme
MTIQSINHVQLVFPALLESKIRHFYGGLVGLTEVAYSPGATLRYRVGQQRIDLVPTADATAAAAAPAAAHLALEVSNLALLRDRLHASRVELDESRPLPGYQRFYLKDPAGNSLEFLEPDAAGENP